MAAFKHQLWELLELTYDEDGHSEVFDWVDIALLVLIVLNVLAVILETVKGIEQTYGAFLHAFDVFSVAVFSVEYVLRLWVCTEDPRFHDHPIRGRLQYGLSFMGIVDILAIAPFYFPAFLPDLRMVRAFRLFRLVRLLKLGRYSESLARIKHVFVAKRDDLLTSLFGVAILLVVASSVMYYVENAAQPDKFTSIPQAMWWGVSTLTTVGYGDIFPITPLGKALGATIAILGIGMFALPTGIIAAGFSEETRKVRTDKGRCAHCGQPLSKEARARLEESA